MMEQSPKNNVLEAYKTLAKFVVLGARGQPPLWPFSIIETNYYYARFFVSELFRTLKGLERKGITTAEIAKLCWGPSAISHWFYFIEPAFGDASIYPFNGLTRAESATVFEKTIELLSHQRTGDVFCRDNKNLILSDSEVHDVYDGGEFFAGDKDPVIMRTIRQLSLTIWHATILLQAGHRAYSHEFHGPYMTDRGVMIVKDFFNLKPGDDIGESVWRFTSNFPYNELRIVEIYPSDTNVVIDMFNHYEINKPPIATAINILGEGYISSQQEVQKLFNQSQQLIKDGNNEISGYSKADWIKKIIQLRYLWLKPHKDILGEDWKPPEGTDQLAKDVANAERVGKDFENNIIAIAQKGLRPDELADNVAQIFTGIIFP